MVRSAKLNIIKKLIVWFFWKDGDATKKSCTFAAKNNLDLTNEQSFKEY